tara:strand:+ start:285 stop:719 length:435 start_codon:yes stop_codon:yes gene_type:complete
MSQLSTLVYIRTAQLPDEILEIIQKQVNLMNWEYWARTRIERIGGLFKNFTRPDAKSLFEPFTASGRCQHEYIYDNNGDPLESVVFWNALMPSRMPVTYYDDYPLMVRFLKYALTRTGMDEKSIVNNEYDLWRDEQDAYVYFLK